MASEFESGFFVREPAWHGLGTVLDDFPSHDKVLELAGLEWEPETVPAYNRVTFRRGEVLPSDAEIVPLVPYEQTTEAHYDDDPDSETFDSVVRRVVVDEAEFFIRSSSTRLVTRSDRRWDQIGTVTPTWAPFYNRWMVEILDQIVGGDGKANVEAMGSLRGGAKTWALVRLDEPMAIAGDDSPTYPFLTLLNSHDGTGSAKVLYTGVRVVCMNTYSLADLIGDNGYTFRHVGSIEEQFEEAKESLAGLRSKFGEWVQLAELLHRVPTTDDEVKTFTNLFLPEPSGKTATDRVKANVERDRELFLKLVNESVTTDSHRGTALGLLDASVEWLDHVKKTQSRSALFNRTMLKPSAAKRESLKLIDGLFDIGLNLDDHGVSNEELVAVGSDFE